MNIAELLKDCPKGTKLYTTVWGDVEFIRLCDEGLITVLPISEPYNRINTKLLYSDGRFTLDGECILFPSKENRDWNTFQRPFKDGDVVITKNKDHIFIFKGDIRHNGHYYTGMCYFGVDLEEERMFKEGFWNFTRLATEEEKQKLFDAIKANGYKWNAETKTLEKLEVNKFDITTLKAFESKVLVRSSMDGLWKPAVFGFRNGYNDNAFYIVGGSCWKQCIPYLNNEYLCGTTNDCDEYFKTWE